MRTHFAAVLLLASSAYAALTITTPAINQCQDAKFTIQGAVGDVQITILPSEKPCEHDGLVIKDGFGNGEALLTKINIPVGTSIVVIADDEASGEEAWSQTIVVGGSAADCAVSSSVSSTTGTTGTRTSTERPAATAPINAAGSTDAPTSGATLLRTSFGFGAAVALAALVFTA